MERLMLSEIAKAVGSSCSSDALINEICTDTRRISPGCVFVAIKGDRFDGHDYVRYAVENGAIAAVVERQIEGCDCIVVADTRMALLDIARYYRRKFNVILVGITGSVGKTTSKEMTALVLSERYKTLKTEGNLNNEIGLPKTLLGINSTHEAAVIEMGMSDFGEIERLSKTAQPTIAMITNIGFSHIENLKTQEGILKAKLEILSGMSDTAPLVVNADDRLLFPLKKDLNRPVYTFGKENREADYFADNIKEDGLSTFFDINYNGRRVAVKLPCLGGHNVLNALGAFAVGILSGVSETQAVSALEKYKSSGIRQNILKIAGQTVIADCYNASPDSMKAALSVLAGFKASGRRIAVLGDMLELGTESERLHKMVGQTVSELKPDKVFTYGNYSKSISDEARSGGVEVFHTDDKEALICELKSFLKEGDAVLFKASRGMKLEEVMERLYKTTD